MSIPRQNKWAASTENSGRFSMYFQPGPSRQSSHQLRPKAEVAINTAHGCTALLTTPTSMELEGKSFQTDMAVNPEIEFDAVVGIDVLGARNLITPAQHPWITSPKPSPPPSQKKSICSKTAVYSEWPSSTDSEDDPLDTAHPPRKRRTRPRTKRRSRRKTSSNPSHTDASTNENTSPNEPK